MTQNNEKVGVAIIGSGNIGTDLMIKIIRKAPNLELLAFIGIDPESDGLKRAEKLGIHTISTGIDGLVADKNFPNIKIVFDATSAKAHIKNNDTLQPHGVTLIDLTPAAIGPFIIPSVNLDQNLNHTNLNMVTCGGQATIPMVYAVNSVSPVIYGEIIASISSRSAGPGTRANIDEFTETTSKAIEDVGGAKKGKAIIVLNPAEPPLIMRDTVYCLVAGDADKQKIEQSVEAMVSKVQQYVPGYRLKQKVQFDEINELMDWEDKNQGPLNRLKVSVFLEVEGAGHYLPSYAGNLDIMTSAALATAVKLVGLETGSQNV